MNQKPSNNPQQISHTPPADDWIEIGKIVAPQGIKGEVRVYPYSDFPQRFEEPGQRWLQYPGEAQPQPIELLAGRFVENKGIYVVQFAGIDDRDKAEALRGCLLFVPESDRPPLEEGEFHILDLIGLTVINQLTGETVGTVVDLVSAGNDLLVVSPASSPTDADKKSKNSQILIPFVMEIVPVVDIEAGLVKINPPPGLLEINR